MSGYKSKKMLTDRQPQATDDEQDDLTLVYMWAFRKGEEKSKARIEELEAEIKRLEKELEFYLPCP
jgi:plasmid stabilization system protein ParE